MDFRFSILGFRLLALAIFFTLSGIACADELEAEASLSQSETTLHEPVELQIKISASFRASIPIPQPKAEGLNIQYVSQSSQQSYQFSIVGGGQSAKNISSVTVTYLVTPQREGDFKIPPITIEASGKKATTKELSLHVGKGTSPQTGSSSGSGGGLKKDGEQNENIMAELIPARTDAFVGEAVPLEFKIYVDDRIRWQPAGDPPEIHADGFALQKIVNSELPNTTKDGRTFNQLVFRTAATAAKAGKLTLGPAEFNIIAQTPQQKRRRHLGGGIFDDDFFDPFGMFAPQQRVTVSAKPVELTIKPLPPGAPKSFAGAIGERFTLNVEASPRNVSIGDPITVTLKISGRGNFDRIISPQLSEPSGWRIYPPSSKFAADDEIGLSGTKTFEIAIVPEEKKSEIPPIEFTYFDPAKEKYVTLQTGRIPIVVEGEKIAAAATPALTQPAPSRATTSGTTASDILYIRPDESRWGVSFEPLFRRRAFWLAQAVPLVTLAGLITFRVRRNRLADAEAMRLAKWREEKIAAEKVLRSQNADEAQFLAAAAKCLQIEAAMVTGKNYAALEASDINQARKIDDETAARIGALFDALHELRYAGVARGGGSLSAKQREEFLATIQAYEKAKPVA